jgi:DNA polymerase-3 subunit epsilon
LPRLLTAALAAAALTALAVGGLILWSLRHLAGIDPNTLLVLGGAGAFGVALAFLLLWLFLDTRVFRPLIALLRRAETNAHPEHDPDTEDTLPHLAPLSGGIASLTRQLAAARRAAASANREALASAEAQRHRLESILHDLSEGVIVCNFSHQVILYNRVAMWLLSGAGEVGIGRPLRGLAEPGPIEKALGELMGGAPEAARTVSLTCRPLGGDGPLPARMALTFGPDNRPDGFVLTLAAEPVAPEEIPSPRREFYDFDLFSRPIAAGREAKAPLRDLVFVVFDTETTGLRPSEGDRLVAIAGVRVVNGRVLRSETFEALIDPGRPIPERATRIHGITDEMVAGAPGAAEALGRFARFADGGVLVAHNAPFDMTFLKAEDPGGALLDTPVLDTRLLSAAIHDHATGHGLDSVAARFGVTLRPGERHTALGDTLATAEIFARMMEILDGRGAGTLAAALALSEKQAHSRRDLPF